MLLEKLELSSGFLNLEKKTNKPHTSRTSLLPSKEIVNLISSAKDGDAENVVNYIKAKNAKLIQKMENLKLSQEKKRFSLIIFHIPLEKYLNIIDSKCLLQRTI